MRLRAGDFVDDMEIVGLLGEGATSEVYLVRDHAGIFRALKLLSVHGQAHRRRMRIEGQALRHVRHENVVGVLAMVEHEGWMGVLMEYVPGPTLHRWMDIEATPVDEAVRLTRGILTGLDVLHQAGLVHRDIKPGNVLLDVSRDGVRPRLADFGLVKQLWGGDSHTHTGVSMGTPTYMAPEQLKDASRVDGRADLFSVGCMLFEMLTGRAPFDRSDMFETWKAIDGGQSVDMSVMPVDVPPRVADVVEGLLEPEPEQRIPNVDVVFELLDGAAPPRPLPPAPPLEPGSEGALRARRLSVELYQGVRSAATGERQDLRGIDPTTFNSEHVQELMELIGEESVEVERQTRRRSVWALGATAVVLLLLTGVATWLVVAPPGVSVVADAADEAVAEPETVTDGDAERDPVGAGDAYPDAADETLASNDALTRPSDALPQPSEGRSEALVASVVTSPRPGGDPGASDASAGGAESPASADPVATGADPVTTGPDAGSSESEAGEAGAVGSDAGAVGSDAGAVGSDAGAVGDVLDSAGGDADGEADGEAELAAGGTIAVSGDAFAVEIVGSDGSVYAPGAEVDPGSYQIRARWTEADEFAGAGQVSVAEGQEVSLRCISAFLRCK